MCSWCFSNVLWCGLVWCNWCFRGVLGGGFVVVWALVVLWCFSGYCVGYWCFCSLRFRANVL